MKNNNKNIHNYLTAPMVVLAFFSFLAVATWQIWGSIFWLINFLYIGIFTAGGMTLYGALPSGKKLLGRRIPLFAVGLYLLAGMGVMGRENAQIEGFFFYVVGGFYAGTVIHYLVAKIVGPILIHRTWCGWGCWTAMVIDLLPHKESSGRAPGKWEWLRYAHLTLSFVLVLVLWYGFSYSIREQPWDVAGLYWLLAGNGFYYGVAIGLAFMVRDNRAFCKYVCPITPFLKATSLFSILRIKGNSESCTECGECVRRCPMDIRITEYIKAGTRVLSTECTLCQTCIDACPTGALRASVALDFGGKELLNESSGRAKSASDHAGP